MLAEIAAEALHFLSRRDLDKTSAVNKWLDATIAQCCDVYPLRPVLEVALNRCENAFKLRVWVGNDGVSETGYSFVSVDEAVLFVASICRHSYVERLELSGNDSETMTLSPGRWDTLIDGVCGGAVERLQFIGLDFSALDDDALLVTVCCRGLQSLVVRRCDVPSGLVVDDLVRSCATEGLLRLSFSENKSDTPHIVSEDVVLEFFFRTDTTPRPRDDLMHLVVEGSGVTDSFLAKFIERLRSTPARPRGSLTMYGAARQRGFAAYTQHLAPGATHGRGVKYRFPSIDDDIRSYEVSLYESTANVGDAGTCAHMDLDFGPV